MTGKRIPFVKFSSASAKTHTKQTFQDKIYCQISIAKNIKFKSIGLKRNVKNFIFISFLSCLFSFSITKQFLLDVLSPVFHVNYKFMDNISFIYDWIPSKKENIIEINKLKKQNEYLIKKIYKIQSLNPNNPNQYYENKDFQIKTMKIKWIISDSIIHKVHLGKNCNENINNSIAVSENGVVGTIFSDVNNEKLIKPLDDISSRIALMSACGNNHYVFKGEKNGFMSLLYTEMTDHNLNVGDILSTSSKCDGIPENIPVGKIVSISGDEVMLKPLASINNLKDIQVYIPKKINN